MRASALLTAAATAALAVTNVAAEPRRVDEIAGHSVWSEIVTSAKYAAQAFLHPLAGSVAHEDEPTSKPAVRVDASPMPQLLAVTPESRPVMPVNTQAFSEADGQFTSFRHAAFPDHKIRVKSDVTLCDNTVKQHVGYLDVGTDKHFFFWFFESRDKPDSDPFLLWLNGGPGCSSLTGLFMELGPCRMSENGNGTVHNDHSWNNKANIVFLDQPVDVGFSYGEGNEAVSNTKEAAKDVYAFLQIFLQTFTKYQPADFHVTGESYAGHYIPQIGATIAAGNAKAEQVAHQRGLAQQSLRPEDLVTIHLDSLAIGNGLTDALVQYKYYPDMACDTKYGPVLTNEQCDQMRGKYETCASLVQSCYKWKTPFACVPATMYCNNAMIGPFQQTGRNVYDVRTDCAPGSKLCYPILEDIEAWLNLPAVQSELGVDRAYQGCNFDVNRNFVMQGDWPLPFQQLLVPLLESGVRILIYAGDADYICNWIGNKAWIRALEWSGQDEFENAEDVDWKVGRTGKVGGKVRAHENLTFLQIYEAGHMVPYDQPEAGAEMIETWIQKKNFA